MSHPHFAGRQSEGTLSAAIGAEDGIRGQERFQDDFDRLVVVLRKNRLGSRSERSGPEPARRRARASTPDRPVSADVSEDAVVP